MNIEIVKFTLWLYNVYVYQPRANTLYLRFRYIFVSRPSNKLMIDQFSSCVILGLVSHMYIHDL